MTASGRFGVLLGVLLLAAGCASDEPGGAAADDTASGSPVRSPTSPPPSSNESSDEGASPALRMECVGDGEPTVVLVAGLNTGGDTFDSLASKLAPTTRVCSYDRAGIGGSPPLPDGKPDPSAGSA